MRHAGFEQIILLKIEAGVYNAVGIVPLQMHFIVLYGDAVAFRSGDFISNLKIEGAKRSVMPIILRSHAQGRKPRVTQKDIGKMAHSRPHHAGAFCTEDHILLHIETSMCALFVR